VAPGVTVRASDVRGLQAEILTRGLSVKYVKNIISGSFRAMIKQTKIDEHITRDVFAGLKWPNWRPPDPDPFTDEERTRILAWYRTKRFGFHCGPQGDVRRLRLHPAFYSFVHLLFWTGMRPSEAAGLQWGDIDLAGHRLHVRRSRHLYDYGAPKTQSADRWVELFPDTVRMLGELRPLRIEPTTPVFTNTIGNPVEPKAFERHWHAGLRILGIRPRGLYCTKDTFVTNALRVGAKIAWLEQQTGVNYLRPRSASTARSAGAGSPDTGTKKRSKISDLGMPRGGLEPQAEPEKLKVFQGPDRQEPPSTPTKCVRRTHRRRGGR